MNEEGEKEGDMESGETEECEVGERIGRGNMG